MNYPALELIWSPTGMGSVVNGHAWPIGGLHPLGEMGLTFGFEGDVRLRYPPPSEGREICRLERRAGAVWLRSLGTARRGRIGVNGRHHEEHELELRHRDLISMPLGPVFRLLEAPVGSARSPTLEAAIRAAPEDRELLKVYGDFLLDHGDPLGERLARDRSSADDALWLDVLATHYEAGRLEVEWEHGLAVKAVLRDALLVFKTLEQAATHLAGLPVMRFLRELTIDVTSDRLSVGDGLHALANVKLPETIRRVSLGDVPAHQRERVERLLDAAPGEVHVGFYTDATLEVLSSKRTGEGALKPGDVVRIEDMLSLGNPTVASLLNPDQLIGGSHILGREGSRYLLTVISDEAGYAKVNGWEVDRYPLRDGDLIEIPGDLTARFRLVR